MKVIVNERFVNVLEEVAGFIGKSVIPIQHNVFMEAKRDNLIFRTSSFDSYVELDAQLEEGWEVEEPGAVLLEPKKVLPFLKKVGKGKSVILEAKDRQLTLATGKSQLSIPFMDLSEFPTPPTVGAFTEITIGNNEEIKRALRVVEYAVSTSDTRPILKGIHLKVNGNELIIEATDAHRMSRIVLPVEQLDEAEVVFYPHRKAFSLLDNWENAKIKIGKAHIVLQGEGYTIYLNTIEGNYPSLDRFTKIEGTGRATVNVADLKSAMDGVCIASGSRNPSPIVSVSQNKVVVELKEESVSFVDEIEAETTGADIKFSINARYVSDALAEIDSQRVDIVYSGPLAPIYLLPKDRADKELHLILPVRKEKL